MNCFKIWTTDEVILNEWRRRLNKAGYKRTNGLSEAEFQEEHFEPQGILVEQCKEYFEYHISQYSMDKRGFSGWCSPVPTLTTPKAIKVLKEWTKN